MVDLTEDEQVVMVEALRCSLALSSDYYTLAPEDKKYKLGKYDAQVYREGVARRLLQKLSHCYGHNEEATHAES